MATILYSNQHSEQASKRLRVLDPLERLSREFGVECLPLEQLRGQADPERAASTPEFERASTLFLHGSDSNRDQGALSHALIAKARCQGKRVVCDVDDQYLIPAPGSPFDAALAPHLDHIRDALRTADVVSVTGSALQDEMRRINPQVAIVPNTVDPAIYPTRPAGPGRLRVGWFGGPTHLGDLLLVLPAVRRLQQQQQAEFILFGMYDEQMSATLEQARRLPDDADSDDPHVAAFLRLARALGGIELQHHPAVPFAEFPTRLAELDLDIGLCPLQDNRFNRSKSAVKFYQYAAVGTLTLASHVSPYLGECSETVPNQPQAWEERLSFLAENPRLRSSILEAQRRWVLERRTPESWVSRYRQLLLGPFSGSLGVSRVEDALEDLPGGRPGLEA